MSAGTVIDKDYNPRVMPKKRAFESIGVLHRRNNDSRPKKEVFVDLETGIMVVDRDRFSHWMTTNSMRLPF
jgi:hypothetical protein